MTVTLAVHALPSETRQPVTCPECGSVRWLSGRAARAAREGRTTGRCSDCRRSRERTIEEQHRFCRWWLDRYSDEELAELTHDLGVPGASAERIARARARVA